MTWDSIFRAEVSNEPQLTLVDVVGKGYTLPPTLGLGLRVRLGLLHLLGRLLWVPVGLDGFG